MEAKAYPLNQILAFERRYVVPTYQRDYEWTREDQWELLFDDLEQVAERLAAARERAVATGHDAVKADREVGPHFLGAIVLDQLPSSAGSIDLRAVIDGQQRLTTLQLLIRGLLDALEQGSPRAAQMRRMLRNPDDTGDADERFKLWPRRRDRAAWRVAMDDECDLTDAHIYLEARRYFAQRAKSYIAKNGRADERSGLLVDAVLGLFKLVVIDLEDNDDAQVIFEVLNGRQTPLSAADLVKNLLFLRAETAHPSDLDRLYDQYWSDFDDPWWKKEVGRGHAARRHSDTLLAAWLTAVREEEATASRLYGETRAYLDQNDRPVRDVLEEIHLYAAEYKVINGVAPESDVRVRKAYQRLNVLGMTTALPLLLWLRMQRANGLDAEQHRIAVVAVESFIMRRVLLGAQTRGYGRAFAQVLGACQKAVREEGSPSIVGAIQDALRRKPQGAHWPSDDEVISACGTRRFYGVDANPRLRLLLGAVDEQLRDSNPKMETATFDYDRLTIEHIMPQAWREHWPIRDAGEAEMVLIAQSRDAIVNRLGNLTLVTGSLNPALSNAAWSDKKTELAKHSALALNGDVVAHPEWDENAIDARSSALGSTACEVWPRPAVASEAELAGPEDARTPAQSVGLDWRRIDRAVEAIPAGYWTSCADVGELGGLPAQAVSARMTGAVGGDGAHRVLGRRRQVRTTFHWADQSDQRDPRRGRHIRCRRKGFEDPTSVGVSPRAACSERVHSRGTRPTGCRRRDGDVGTQIRRHRNVGR